MSAELPFESERRRLAAAHLAPGDGIEIGALVRPLPVPSGCRVRYVDHLATAALRERFPKHAATMVEVDVVDDGASLETFRRDSLDFVIANHMIEHCLDPIRAIHAYLRVLRPGGIVFMAVPDKGFTFDRRRPVTTLRHLVRDYTDGGARTAAEHYCEWARDVAQVPEEQVAQRARALAKKDSRVHFHVFTPESFHALLEHLRGPLFFPFEIVALTACNPEFVVILRKLPEDGADRRAEVRHGEAQP